MYLASYIHSVYLSILYLCSHAAMALYNIYIYTYIYDKVYVDKQRDKDRDKIHAENERNRIIMKWKFYSYVAS